MFLKRGLGVLFLLAYSGVQSQGCFTELTNFRTDPHFRYICTTIHTESVWVSCQACGFHPRDSYQDQLLLAESAANRDLGSSRWVWLALYGRKGSREGSLDSLCGRGQKEGREKREQCVADRQMSGCGAESGELDTWRPKVSIFPQSAWHLASS